ncbi:MAG: hypothetical protein ACKO2Z_10210 [Sphaerospermopsis kisseleviana]
MQKFNVLEKQLGGHIHKINPAPLPKQQAQNLKNYLEEKTPGDDRSYILLQVRTNSGCETNSMRVY